MSLPPGPKAPPFYLLIRYLFRPDRFFADGFIKYGINFSAQFSGLGKFVFLGDPVAIRDVFLGDPEVLRTGEANSFAADTLGTNSILTLDGEEHEKQRQALTPPFNARNLNSLLPIMQELCDREIDCWQPGNPVNLEDACREISLLAILRLIFGTQQGPELDELAGKLRKLTRLLSHPLAFAAPIIPKVFTRSTTKLLTSIDESLFHLIDQKRVQANEKKDLLSTVLTMRHQSGQPLGNREIRDHLFTMLLAGHDTTAIALAWAINDILAHPQELDLINSELNEVLGSGAINEENLPRLHRLDAAIKESLRLHPLVDYCVRYLKAPFEANGVTYPAGITLAPCALLLHMNPEIYPQPDAFKPSRFYKKRPDNYEWIPFGGGKRRCLGMKFALFEMRIVLASILRRVCFETPKIKSPPVQRRGLFLAPANRAALTPLKINSSKTQE